MLTALSNYHQSSLKKETSPFNFQKRLGLRPEHHFYMKVVGSKRILYLAPVIYFMPWYSSTVVGRSVAQHLDSIYVTRPNKDGMPRRVRKHTDKK